MNIRDAKILHRIGKKAPVGAEIACPICADKFVKKVHHAVFCKNRCSRLYFNMMDTEKKREAKKGTRNHVPGESVANKKYS